MLEFIIFPPIYFTKPQKMKKGPILQTRLFNLVKISSPNLKKKVKELKSLKKKSHVVQCSSCSAYLTYSIHWYALSFLPGGFEILNIFGNPGGSNDTRLTAKKCIFSFTTGFFCKKKSIPFLRCFFLNLLFTLRNKKKRQKFVKKQR